MINDARISLETFVFLSSPAATVAGAVGTIVA